MENLLPNNGALRDINVLELGQLIAGPFCGQLLGDMGANVVKVEAPGKGDPMRAWGHGTEKLWWEIVSRNKKAITANLRVAEGQELIRRLVPHFDILIENFKPGTLEKWGLSPEALQAINSRLIIVRVSGYGQTGPYSERAGFGGIGEAMGGWRAIVGDPDRPPSRMGVSIGDSLAATYGCMGALAAVHAREKTGKGQVIDSALYESVLQVMESLVPEFVVQGHVRQRTGSILEGVAPSNVYPCKDGEYLIGANKDEIFRRLCEAMGQPDLAINPCYATHVARGENQKELDEIIADWTSGLKVQELENLMVEYSIPAGKMFGARDMIENEHFQARNSLVDIDHPRFGTLKMQNAFPKFSDTPSSIRRHAPQEVGQDNEAVYGELLNLSKQELAQMEEANII